MKIKDKQLDTLDTKKRFIELYRSPESGANISTVCEGVGIARATYYLWIDNDEEFAKQMYDARMEQADNMEQQLYQRGYEKSDTALIYWLKHNHPKYKEQPTVLIQNNFNDHAKKELEEFNE